MKKILCVGISVADIIVKTVDSFPDKGKLTLVDTMNFHTGGCSVNAAIDLAKIGEHVELITLIGNDNLGNFLKDELTKNNVGISGIKVTDKAATSSSVVLSSSDGERSFLHTVGANKIFSSRHIDVELLKSCDIVFIGGALLMETFDGEETQKILKLAKELEKTTVLDTAWDDTPENREIILSYLPYLDYFMPSFEEAKFITDMEDEKAMAEFFLEMGAKNVAIKLGEKGCYFKSSRDEFYTDAFKVNVVDTNGAGDSFIAGVLTGISNSWNDKKTMEFACATGAFCVQSIGASSGISDKETILKFIKNYKEVSQYEKRSI